MNEIVNRLLLAGNKFMFEMHLKQPGFTYSACGPFTKNKERFQKFKETGDTSRIYKNELDKACFQHDMTYEDFKDEAVRDKAFNIAINPKYDGYQRGLASMVYKLFDKKSNVSGANMKAMSNEQLPEELSKPIVRTFKKRIADLADMQLISNFNKGFRFLLCVIDIFSKYAWVVPLKDKKGIKYR